METKLGDILERGVAERVFPGGVCGVVTREGKRTITPVGTLRYTTPSHGVTGILKGDTIYDVASVTKSIPTAMIALQLVDEGFISLETKLTEYVPEFKSKWRDDVLVRHLLTYGLDYVHDGVRMADYAHRPVAELEAYIFEKELGNPPGTIFMYTNRPAHLLGLLVERVTGKKLDELAEERFFEPLGIKSTTFLPLQLQRTALSKNEVAPSEQDEHGEDVCGIVHDEGARVFRKVGRTVGFAGLFSTVPDLLTFMEMLLRGGELGGRRYFSEVMVERMTENQIAHLGEFTGLGWELNQPHWMGKYAGAHSIGKTGFTGARIVADRSKGKAMVLLANRIYPKRPPTAKAFNTVSAALCDIVFV